MATSRAALKKMIAKMLNIDIYQVRNSEDFDGNKGGIWISGESDYSLNKLPVFNYYATGSLYEFGVLKKFNDFLVSKGWHSEWYDAGTMMIWRGT